MRLILVTALLLSSCARHDSGEAEPSILEQAKPYYIQACESYNPENTPRCDRSTFVAWMTLLCNKDFGLSAYEKESGVWWRSPESCYPDESKSQCSRDAYLAIIFEAYKRKDFQRIKDIYDYAEKNAWVMCEGDEAVTSIAPLKSIIVKILSQNNMPLVGESSDALADDLDIIEKALSGFRGHLVAGYLWLRGDVLGGLTSTITLKALKDQTPDSPYFSALYHRFDSKNNSQEETLRLMKNTGPENNFGWGSSPAEFFPAASYVVMLGN